MKIAQSITPGSAALNLVIQPLWDSVQLGKAQTTPIQLFTVPLGQSSKTRVDTNVVQSGGLPSPNEFYLRGFLVQPLPLSPLNATFALTDVPDATRALDQTIFSFYIGTSGRKLVEGHAQLFPAGLGIDGMVTTGGATSANNAYIMGSGVRRLDNRFGLGDFAEKLNATESFRGQFEFPSASGLVLSSSITFRVYLAGILGQSVG